MHSADRLEVAAIARSLGRSPSVEQMTALEAQRNRLQNQINDFVEEAHRYLPDDLDGDLHNIPFDDGAWDTVENLDDNDGPDGPVITVDDAAHDPERQHIPLPSMLKPQNPSANFHHMQTKEFDLRIGQANDALARLRLAVAQRSIIYRTDVRNTTGYAGMTRARQKVHSAGVVVASAARVYSHCRRAMVELAPQSRQLDTYRKLELADLKADTKAMDYNAPGTRNAQLSWIWGVDGGDSEANELTEGISDFMVLPDSHYLCYLKWRE